jgi:hypothetical protein
MSIPFPVDLPACTFSIAVEASSAHWLVRWGVFANTFIGSAWRVVVAVPAWFICCGTVFGCFWESNKGACNAEVSVFKWEFYGIANSTTEQLVPNLWVASTVVSFAVVIRYALVFDRPFHRTCHTGAAWQHKDKCCNQNQSCCCPAHRDRTMNEVALIHKAQTVQTMLL